MTFRADNFDQMHASFITRAQEAGAGEAGGRGGGRGRGRGRGRGGRGRGGNKTDTGDVAADIMKILKMIKQRQLEPVIVFSFARRSASITASMPGLILSCGCVHSFAESDRIFEIVYILEYQSRSSPQVQFTKPAFYLQII